MFAPPVAKPKSARPNARRLRYISPRQAAITQGQPLQRTLGNQSMLRLLAQRATVTRNERDARQNEDSVSRRMPSMIIPVRCHVDQNSSVSRMCP